jgi:hypothetical protein
MYDFYMVFDVESVGLHGEGFAVSWWILDKNGKFTANASYSCPLEEANGTKTDRDWVKENVTVPPVGICRTPRLVRDMFWDAWIYTKKRGGVLVADCNWPVESHFLNACIQDDPDVRRSQGPYPFLDLASIRFALGYNPIEENQRLENELPCHNPLTDAKQSARLLAEALRQMNDSLT